MNKFYFMSLSFLCMKFPIMINAVTTEHPFKEVKRINLDPRHKESRPYCLNSYQEITEEEYKLFIEIHGTDFIKSNR